MDTNLDKNNTTIELAKTNQVDTLTEFQLKMAMETEKLELDAKLVHDAITYLLDSESKKQGNELGMLLVKKRQEKLIGTLLLTFQSDYHWWIQSVYVIEEERRRGHFTSLFNQSVKLGKERKAKSIRLYVETQNARAKTTYQKLGMHQIEQKMHSYDFVYGNFSLENEASEFHAEKVVNGKENLSKYVEGQYNILTGLKYEESDWNHVYAMKKGDKIYAVAKIFPEFSDWRFGVMWYFRQLYIVEGQKMHYQELINAAMKVILKDSFLKVGAIRVLYRETQNLKFKGGHLENYYIMRIEL